MLNSLVTLTADIPHDIVPGRPVKKLEICCWLDAPLGDVMQRLGQGSTHMRALLVSTGFKISASDLYIIATNLPFLEYLGELWLNDHVSKTLDIWHFALPLNISPFYRGSHETS